MTRAEINRTLYRPIRSGKEYEWAMPFSDCSSTKLGDGDTSFAIDNMAKTARKYQHHTQRLTQAFFSSKTTLFSLVSDIQDFLYWHFQYAIDGQKQLLRSPACSWVSRHQGIDCKSYSIFASTILLNLGISHYMRRIKQKMNPEAFTHVYVVVPKNQKTNDLSDDYYTIDGTIDISVSQELPRIAADDIFIEAQPQKTAKTAGLGVPLVAPKDSVLRLHQRQKAWDTFTGCVKQLKALNPDNMDLQRLKNRIYELAKKDVSGVCFKVEGFSVWLDGECFRLLSVPVEGLGATQISQEIDTLIAQSEMQSQAYIEQAHNLGVQRVQTIVNAVGNTAAAVANVVPGIGQILSAALIAVTALVSLAVMFGYNPCASMFYKPDYINENLQKNFLEPFKTSVGRVIKHFQGGTETLAISEFNKLLREIDLGYFHYQNELKVNRDDCERGALAGYSDFVNGIKGLIDNLLQQMKGLLDEFFNVAIVEKEGISTSRTWFFVVPNSKNPIRLRHRVMSVESRSKKKGIYPYGSEENFDNWLNTNVTDIAFEYGKEAGARYRREMLPFKQRIREIRQNIGLPMVTLIALEDKLRAEQYAIYLKYDKKYHQELLKLTNDQHTARLLANKAFWEELKKIRAIRLSQNQNDKKVTFPASTFLNAGLVAAFSFLIFKVASN